MSDKTIDSLDIQIETSLGSDTASQIRKASNAIKRMAENLSGIDTSKLEKLNSLFKGTKELESYAQSIKTVSSSIKSLSKVDQSGLENVKNVLKEISDMKMDFSQFKDLQNIDFSGLKKYSSQLDSIKKSAGKMDTVIPGTPAGDNPSLTLNGITRLRSEWDAFFAKENQSADAFNQKVSGMGATRKSTYGGRTENTGYKQYDTKNISKFVNDFADKTDKASQKAKKAQENWEKFTDGLKKIITPKINTDSLKQLEKEIASTSARYEKLTTDFRNRQLFGESIKSEPMKHLQVEIAKAEKMLDEMKAKYGELSSKAIMHEQGRVKNAGTPVVRSKDIEKLQFDLAKAQQNLRDLLAEKERLKNSSLGFNTSQLLENATAINATKQQIKALQSRIDDVNAGKLGKISTFSGIAKGALSKLTGALKLLGKGFKWVGGKALSLGKKFISSKNGANNLSNGLNGGFKAFMRYGLGIRSTFVLLNKLRSSFTGAMNNLVQYSNTTNRAVSSMWNSLNALKNSLATAFAPVINSVAPYVSALIDMLTDAMNAIAQFFAAITGSKTVVVAKKQNKSYAASLGSVGSSASDSADKVKDLADSLDLLDFDEINKLSDNTSNKGSGSSGSGSGGGSGSGVSGMFETVTVDSAFKDLADLFKNGNWDEIGDIIADGINSAVGKIDEAIKWDNVGEKITNICTGITSIFNRVVDKMDWSMLGKTVGDGVNTVIYTINLLYDGVDWGNLGSKLATGVNSIFETVDWDAVGAFLVRKFNAVWEFGAGFFNNLDGKSIGEDIGTALNSAMKHLNLNSAKSALSGALNTLSDIIEGFNETVNWDGISSGITTFFDGVFDDVKWKELGENLGTLVGNLAKVIIETVMDPTMQDKLFAAGGELVGGFVKGALDALTNGAFSDLVEKLKKIPILGDIIDNSEFSLTPLLDQLRKQLNDLDTSSLVLQLRANLGLDVSADELLGDFLNDWNSAHPEAKIDDSLANGGTAEWKEWAKEFNASNPKVTIPDEVANGGGKTIMNWLLDAYKENPELVIPTETDKTGGETAAEYLGGWSAVIHDNPAVLKTKTDKTGEDEAEGYETSWNYANPTGNMQVACSTLPVEMAQWFVGLFTKEKATGEIDVETSKTGGQLKQGLSTEFNQFSINPFSVDVEGKLKDKLDTSAIGNLSVDAGVKATGIDPNGKSIWAPYNVANINNNGKSMWAAYNVNSLNNNGKSMLAPFNVSNVRENGKYMSAMYSVSKVEPNGKTLSAPYKVTEVDTRGQVKVSGEVRSKNDISKKTNGKAINAVAAQVQVKKVTGVSGAINKFLKMIGIKEKGGVYSNGSWSNLPQFAGGGLITSQKIGRFAGGGLPMHGTMFAAGEKGSEIVGNINGRTEVLNQSQIASAIYSAMIQAMKQQNVNVDVSLQGDANTMFKVVQQKARQYTVQTGKMPFAY